MVTQWNAGADKVKLRMQTKQEAMQYIFHFNSVKDEEAGKIFWQLASADILN